MAVVIDTPVRTSARPGQVLTCAAGNAYSRPSEQAGHWIDVTSNQEFLGAILGGRGRFHYASRDKLCVVSAPSAVGAGPGLARQRPIRWPRSALAFRRSIRPLRLTCR